MTGRLVIMGSGETAPTMVEVHRSVLRAAGADRDGPTLLLDTPYGFQENADEITARAVAYFAGNVRHTLSPLRWRERLDGDELDRALAAVRTASAVFAGPGSPTYALRVWQGSGLAEELIELVRRGGTVTFASAAALTIGVASVPVYEIYKSGQDPHWVPAMDVLSPLTGLRAAVIPHYDNTEGGTHSTRYCYLGQRRLRLLEPQLPAGAHVIGVDEHTALVLDLAAGTAAVLGHGVVTVRVAGASRELPAGLVVPIGELAVVPTATAALPTVDQPAAPVASPADKPASEATSLRAAAQHERACFDEALASRDADAAATAVLTLEQAIHDWSADTLQSDDVDIARRTLRGMVLALAAAAHDGLVDPRERLKPLVDALLEQREAARRQRDYAAADGVRERLAAAGVELRDTPAGPEWTVRTA